jgi:transcription antitermination factor NusG
LSKGSKKVAANPKVAVSAPPAPPKWVIVQLTPLGEREKNLALIVRSAQRILGKTLDVFVPAVSQKVRDESQTMFYMDGYVFVRHEEGVNYLKLADTTYFNCVLSQTSVVNGERRKIYSLLNDKDIAPMRVGMQGLKLGVYKEGQKVKITKGNFKNLQAEISYVHEDGEHAQVYVKLRSKPILMDFPVSYFKKMEDEPK